MKLRKTVDEEYTLKTHGAFEKIEGYEGSLQVVNAKEITLFEGIVKRGKRKQYGKEYDSAGELIYEGQFENDWYEGWGRTKHY